MSEKNWIDLSDKVVIVTGGSMGIGEATVQDLYNCGASVAIFDVVPPKAECLSERVVYFNVDIRNKEQVENAVSQTVSCFGHIDALINNAGVTRPRILVDYYEEAPEYELDEDALNLMIDINMKGTYLVSQAVARYLYKQRFGIIVNLSSCAGLIGSRAHSGYAATKAAIHAFTMSWAKELGPFNVRVVGVAPGILDRTPSNNDEKYRAQAYGRGMGLDKKPEDFFKGYKSSIPLGRPGHLYEVSNLICYLVSDHASYITGITIPVAGGKTKG